MTQRVALVTGGGRGIGREAALLLSAAGVRVMAVSRSAAELEAVGLEYVAADLGTAAGCALAVAETELKNFGLVPEAQGRGLGPWLLGISLQHEWSLGPERIWLHTDTWDHPAAIPTYERAGFRVYAVRQEPVGPL